MSAALFIVALSFCGGAVIFAMSLKRLRDEPSETIPPTTLTDMREHAKPVRANATCSPVWPPRGPQP